MKTKFLTFCTLLFLAMSITSCSKDENDKKTETINIVDAGLVSALKELGFELEGNSLKINQKVKETKSLDLSGKKISNLEGIKAFESLAEINLANNVFDLEFDFAQLPKGVTSIDLQGNDLYEFYNITSDRTISKLYLPEQARFNMEDVLDFYKANKETVDKGSIDMKMMVKGELKQYTSLREIPDPNLKKYLKGEFPVLFTNSGDLLDIATPLRVPESTKDLFVQEKYDDNYKDNIVDNFEGVQYVLQHKDYGASIVMLEHTKEGKNNTLEYLKLPDNGLTWIWIKHLHINKGIKITSKSLKSISLWNVSGFKTLDLSSSSNFFVGGLLSMPTLELHFCPDLEEIIVPKSNLSDLQIGQIRLLKLPKLQKADFSNLDNFWGNSYFEEIPLWDVQFPKKLVKVEHQINIRFDRDIMMTKHKDKCIDLMHKVVESTNQYVFYQTYYNENNEQKSNTIDKDGNIIQQ